MRSSRSRSTCSRRGTLGLSTHGNRTLVRAHACALHPPLRTRDNARPNTQACARARTQTCGTNLWSHCRLVRLHKSTLQHTQAVRRSNRSQATACARKSRGRNVLRCRGSWMRWSALSSHAKRQCRSRRSHGWAHPTPTPGNGTGPAVPTSAPGTGCKAAVSKRKRLSAVVPTTAQSPRGAISHPALVTDYGGALSATVRWRMCAVPHCSHGRTRPWRRSVRKCGQGAA